MNSIPRRNLLAPLSLCILSVLGASVVVLISGCINKPQNPAATQPATAVDPVTTQPSYWLNQPAAAQVQASDFDHIWNTCKSVARSYLYQLDREDYRDGLITTVPMISKQWFEPWRPDTGTVGAMLANSTSAFRRTLRFEIDRNADNTFTITPKVLVERQALLERRVTDASQYRLAFAGASLRQSPRYSYTFDSDVNPNIVPYKYFYPIARDTEMEKHVAERLRKELRNAPPPAVADSIKQVAAPGTAAQASDGAVAAVGLSDTVYINLGTADKIAPGMTFAVFEKRVAIPPLDQFGDQNTGLKGWIEVLTVANTSSTCKVIKRIGDAPIAQGDILFNFIYQRGRQNHFVIAGTFETATRDTLTGLIWRWNGAVDDTVDANTSYVILGKAPQDAPSLKLYEQVREAAAAKDIPTLDEARFNLLIRYYDPSKR